MTDGVEGAALVAGRASGRALVLTEPLSFWGGADAETGLVVDTHHPQCGAALRGCVLVMPSGRGSSSSTSVLAEMLRAGTGPVAIVLGAADPIIVLACVVAEELYAVRVPVVVLDEAAYGACVDAARGADAALTVDAGDATAVVRSG